jgi:hypothetical protein
MTATAAFPRHWRGIMSGVVLSFLLAGAVLPRLSAGVEPGKALTPTPEQIRARMARVRADLERRRRELETVAAKRPTAPAAGKRPSLPPLAGGGRRRSREVLEYHFERGQSFAYSVELTVGSEGSRRVERFRGTPYVVVKSVDDSGETELFVIGKLECSILNGDGEVETPRPDRAVWLGSRIALKPSGGWVGKEDVNAKALPGHFETLNLKPKRLIFPEMPRTLPGVDDSSGSASLFVTFAPRPVLTLAFGALDGKATRTRHADPIEPSLARLTHEVEFQTNASVKPRVNLVYRSVARFDRDLGRLRDCDSTFRQEQDGGRSMVATARVRLLEGDALRKAYARALADWQDRPEALEPVEFRRIRVDPFLPTHLESTRDATAGLALFHLRGTSQGHHDADNKYYLVEVLGLDSSNDG